MADRKMLPPDGGWGWVVVFAYALNHLILVPIMQSFGLIFKDKFIDMNFSATDGSIIINMNAALSMMTGLINGPLLKYFGYRKVSYAGAFFTFLGLVLTAYANSFISLLVTYGLIASLGMGMGMGSYPLALNSYFVKKRNKAAGISMTITGLGPVLMPQLISFLLYIYDVKGAMIVIAAVSMNSFVAASLLQPVRWHMVEEKVDEEKGGPVDDKEAIKEEESSKSLLPPDDENKNGPILDRNTEHRQSIVSIDHDTEVHAIYGFDTPLTGSMLSLSPNPNLARKFSMESYKSTKELGQWPSSVSVLRNGKNRARSESADQGHSKPYNPNMTTSIPEVQEEQKVGLWKRMSRTLVTIFDLNLLKDPIYVNIMIGMSLAVFAELNFSLLTPFILADLHLTTSQIAMFLSVLSTADICFRFLSPFIGDFLNKPPRIMYMFSLSLLIMSRFTLLFFVEYKHLLVVAVGLGIAKGIRTVYWTLVIPAYVPIDKLANASGIQMVVNGIFILAGGPLLGVIRDVTGSYSRCIYVMNMVTLVTITIWSIEMLYLKYWKPKAKGKEILG